MGLYQLESLSYLFHIFFMKVTGMAGANRPATTNDENHQLRHGLLRTTGDFQIKFGYYTQFRE